MTSICNDFYHCVAGSIEIMLSLRVNLSKTFSRRRIQSYFVHTHKIRVCNSLMAFALPITPPSKTKWRPRDRWGASPPSTASPLKSATEPRHPSLWIRPFSTILTKSIRKMISLASQKSTLNARLPVLY